MQSGIGSPKGADQARARRPSVERASACNGGFSLRLYACAEAPVRNNRRSPV